jgi:hypothetical protein
VTSAGRALALVVLLAVGALVALGRRAARQTNPAVAHMRDTTGVEGGPGAKRVAPPEVAPLSAGGLRIQAVHWGKERGLAHNGGYIAALDSSGKELWTLEVYRVVYDSALESDVQDVFISSMTKGRNPDEINVTDERDRHYTVNVKTRTVQRR